LIKSFRKTDRYFLLILSAGIILRFLSFLFVPIVDDTISYIESAKFIIELNYESLRPPVFPLLIVPLLLLTGNGPLSAKIISLMLSILLIISAYFVFTKASLKLLKNSEERENKAKKIGLFTTFFITFNLFFIIHSGKGLREDLIALIYILLFYFIMIKKKLTLRDNLSLAIIISLLILTQLSTGFFTIIGIILFYILSKFKGFKFESISFNKLLVILSSFLCSFIFWAIFSAYKWEDPLANWNIQGAWFGIKYGVSISTFGELIRAILHALSFGLPSIFIYLFVLFGFVFIIVMLLFFIKNSRNEQILFIFIIVFLNYAYLTIYITTPRVIMYYFYTLIFIATIPITITIVKLGRKEKRLKKRINYLIIIFLITYVLRGLDTISIIYLIYQIYNYIPHFAKVNTIISIFSQQINPIILTINIIVIIINEISILIIFIKSKNFLSFKIKENYKESYIQ
jgi:hypothetical protein